MHPVSVSLTNGPSPFVWRVIGVIAHATQTLRLSTGVTCPTMRIHPAIIAQAAATCAAIMPGRFFLGVGTGEDLNEHILGDKRAQNFLFDVGKDFAVQHAAQNCLPPLPHCKP